MLLETPTPYRCEATGGEAEDEGDEVFHTDRINTLKSITAISMSTNAPRSYQN